MQMVKRTLEAVKLKSPVPVAAQPERLCLHNSMSSCPRWLPTSVLRRMFVRVAAQQLLPTKNGVEAQRVEKTKVRSVACRIRMPMYPLRNSRLFSQPVKPNKGSLEMTNQQQEKNAGQVLVDALRLHGADMAFCVPGESYLPVLDALYDARDAIRLIVCRQEGGAAYMADAYGKLTGRPGLCFVTRGPGASNAAVGLHTAFQDSSPMILFIGQVGRDMIEREAFQELDYRRMFGQSAKWVAQIDDARRIPEFISRAFHTAVSGRPGPVVLALPEDMLWETVDPQQPAHYQRVAAHPSKEDMVRLQTMISTAERPLMILGGRGWTEQACEDIRLFAERFALPTACAFRFQDLFDATHRNYIGDVGLGINPALAQRIKEADLVLAIGTRLGEATTSGYMLFDVPRPKQRMVHVHAGLDELGRVYAADLLIASGMPEFAAATKALPAVATMHRLGKLEAARSDYLAFSAPKPNPGPLQMGAILGWLREHLPPEAIICNGAGNYAAWVHRYYHHRRFGTQLAPTNGSMGYGVPAAVAAKLIHPERMVVAFAGDGCFMMNGQELATAVQYGAAIVIIVVNNSMYGTIRMHQERSFPTRVYGTELVNPDFAALAGAYGAYSEIVTETDQFAPAFDRALAAGKPALLELRLDPEALSPSLTMSALREQAGEKG